MRTLGSTEYRVYKQESTGQVLHLNTDQEYNAHTVKNSDKAAAKKQSWTAFRPTIQRSYAPMSPNYTTATNEITQHQQPLAVNQPKSMNNPAQFSKNPQSQGHYPLHQFPHQQYTHHHVHNQNITELDR